MRSADLRLAASLVTIVILPYPGVIAPLQRKKEKLKKAHAYCCLSALLPWTVRRSPGVQHGGGSGIREARSLPSPLQAGFVIPPSIVCSNVIFTFLNV